MELTNNVNQTMIVEKLDKIMDVQKLARLSQEGQIAEAKGYIMQFFFKFGINIMFDDGNTFNMYKRTEACELLPSDACFYGKKRSVFEAKDFLKTSEFIESYLSYGYVFQQAQNIRIGRKTLSEYGQTFRY